MLFGAAYDMDVAIRRQPHYATLESKSPDGRVVDVEERLEVHADLIDVTGTWPNQRGLNLDAYFPALTIKDGARTARQVTECGVGATTGYCSPLGRSAATAPLPLGRLLIWSRLEWSRPGRRCRRLL